MSSPDDAIPPSLKNIRPYLQRAKELEEARPLVSYYANLYALQRGIRERDQSDEAAAAYIKGLLTRCERMRARFAGDVDSHRAQLEEFALQVYEDAKRTYRSGAATMGTAQHFFAAMCFFDICTHFGDLTEDMAGFRARAKVYAAKIRMDIRQTGRAPPPATLAEEHEQDADGTAQAQLDAEMAKPAATSLRDQRLAPEKESYLGPPTATPYEHPAPFPPSDGFIDPRYPSLGGMYISNKSNQSSTPEPPHHRPAMPFSPPSRPAPAPQPAAPSHSPPPFAQPSRREPAHAPVPAAPRIARDSTPRVPAKVDGKTILQAQKKAKFAVSALDFQDVKTAVSELEAALNLLCGTQAAPN